MTVQKDESVNRSTLQKVCFVNERPILCRIETVYGERGQDMSVLRDAGQGQAMTNSRSEKSRPLAGYRAPHHISFDIVIGELGMYTKEDLLKDLGVRP